MRAPSWCGLAQPYDRGFARSRGKKKGPQLRPFQEDNRRLPTLPGGCPPSTIGASGLNFSVRNGKRCFPAAMTAETGLQSRARLQAGLGVQSLYRSRARLSSGSSVHFQERAAGAPSKLHSSDTRCSRSRPRAISTGPLNTLLCLHVPPINVVVSHGSYSLEGMGGLISRWASRLDAFSGYPNQTWLTSSAVGTTTDTPEVRSLRSSRTRSDSSQASNAHGG